MIRLQSVELYMSIDLVGAIDTARLWGKGGEIYCEIESIDMNSEARVTTLTFGLRKSRERLEKYKQCPSMLILFCTPYYVSG